MENALTPEALAALTAALGAVTTFAVAAVKTFWPKKIKQTENRTRIVSAVVGAALSVLYMLGVGLDPVANVELVGTTILAGTSLHEWAKFVPWKLLGGLLERVAKRLKKKD